MSRYQIPNLMGKTAVVTGANSGIGFWTAAGLSKAGARVVLVCRNGKRGEEARSLLARQGGVEPELIVADFADLHSVRDAGAKIAGSYPRLDLLINNAGLFAPKRTLTKDGYETTFQVNHLAPFLLTNTLLPALERAGEPGRSARIVVVASAAANRASIDLNDLMAERGRYNMLAAYGRSKLANILFTKELARRLPPRPVTVNCLHPGVVATEIGNKGGVASVVWSLLKPFMITSEKGAENSLYVATSPSIEGVSGDFFVRQRATAPNPIANDAAIARRLWEESERLVDAALARKAAA
jgi:NAD(P)-dependent dehydrogenase (short-subunit alcohol dehydrogenase family)